MKQNIQYNSSDLLDHYGIWIWLENDKEQIFMQYHNKFGCWTIPLEKSDPGESLEDATIRAGKEELGITIREYKIIHTQKNSYEREGHSVNVIGNLVKVMDWDGEPQNIETEKHSDFGWKDKDFIKGLKESTDAVKALQKYI